MNNKHMVLYLETNDMQKGIAITVSNSVNRSFWVKRVWKLNGLGKCFVDRDHIDGKIFQTLDSIIHQLQSTIAGLCRGCSTTCK